MEKARVDYLILTLHQLLMIVHMEIPQVLANATDYLNLYYDPDKDPARTNTTEQAKPNGTVARFRNSNA